jgi:hypothetical protein
MLTKFKFYYKVEFVLNLDVLQTEMCVKLPGVSDLKAIVIQVTSNF